MCIPRFAITYGEAIRQMRFMGSLIKEIRDRIEFLRSVVQGNVGNAFISIVLIWVNEQRTCMGFGLAFGHCCIRSRTPC